MNQRLPVLLVLAGFPFCCAIGAIGDTAPPSRSPTTAPVKRVTCVTLYMAERTVPAGGGARFAVRISNPWPEPVRLYNQVVTVHHHTAHPAGVDPGQVKVPAPDPENAMRGWMTDAYVRLVIAGRHTETKMFFSRGKLADIPMEPNGTAFRDVSLPVRTFESGEYRVWAELVRDGKVVDHSDVMQIATE